MRFLIVIFFMAVVKLSVSQPLEEYISYKQIDNHGMRYDTAKVYVFQKLISIDNFLTQDAVYIHLFLTLATTEQLEVKGITDRNPYYDKGLKFYYTMIYAFYIDGREIKVPNGGLMSMVAFSYIHGMPVMSVQLGSFIRTYFLITKYKTKQI